MESWLVFCNGIYSKYFTDPDEAHKTIPDILDIRNIQEDDYDKVTKVFLKYLNNALDNGADPTKALSIFINVTIQTHSFSTVNGCFTVVEALVRRMCTAGADVKDAAKICVDVIDSLNLYNKVKGFTIDYLSSREALKSLILDCLAVYADYDEVALSIDLIKWKEVNAMDWSMIFNEVLHKYGDYEYNLILDYHIVYKYLKSYKKSCCLVLQGKRPTSEDIPLNSKYQ